MIHSPVKVVVGNFNYSNKLPLLSATSQKVLENNAENRF